MAEFYHEFTIGGVFFSVGLGFGNVYAFVVEFGANFSGKKESATNADRSY